MAQQVQGSVSYDVTAVGRLASRVLEYTDLVQSLVPTATSSADWEPLTRYVATDDFQRVGTFLEIQDWQQYIEMMTGWASATDSFDLEVHRIAELGRLVYFEIEERHHRGGDTHVVNTLTVFELGQDDRIRRIHVYLQQQR